MQDETKSSRLVCCRAGSTKTFAVHGNEVTEGKSEAWPSPHFIQARLTKRRLVPSLSAMSLLHTLKCNLTSIRPCRRPASHMSITCRHSCSSHVPACQYSALQGATRSAQIKSQESALIQQLPSDIKLKEEVKCTRCCQSRALMVISSLQTPPYAELFVC